MKAQNQPTQSQSTSVRRSSERPQPIKDQSFEDLYISAEHAIDALERSVESAQAVFEPATGMTNPEQWHADRIASAERSRAAATTRQDRAFYDETIAMHRAGLSRLERDRAIDASEARVVAHTTWRAQEHDDSTPPANVVSREDLARLTSAFRSARSRCNTAWSSYHPYDHIPIAW